MSDDNSLISTNQDNMDMMKIIATNQQSLEDIKMLTSSKVTDQLKVFLISQARNELTRVIKLTQFLDRLESQFMGKVNEAMVSDDLTLKQYSEIISVITSLLTRSNEIISKVLKDDTLMTILNTTIYTSDSSSTTTAVVGNLKDAQSRERVRFVIQSLMHKMESVPQPQPNVVVEIDESEGGSNE